MDYFSGQKVICIEDFIGRSYLTKQPVDCPCPIKGNIYTVSGVSLSGGLYLEELKTGWSYNEKKFAPLEDFGSSILRTVKAVTEVKKVKELETVKQFTA